MHGQIDVNDEVMLDLIEEILFAEVTAALDKLEEKTAWKKKKPMSMQVG